MTGTMMKPPPTPMMAESRPTSPPSKSGRMGDMRTPERSKSICQGNMPTSRAKALDLTCFSASFLTGALALRMDWRLSMNM